MTNTKRIWIWTGVVIVLLLILVLLGAFSGKNNQPVTQGVPTYAPQGQLVTGFPQELVLDPTAQLGGSYGINYSTSTNQYTAMWTSSKSLDDLYSAYKTYFQNNGWTISNEMTAYAGTKGLHAAKGTASAGLSVVDNGASRKISVTYVAQ
jgi:hypothetical protein